MRRADAESVGESSDEDSGPSDDWKLAVVARRDLGMTSGKLAVQVGHAVHTAVVQCPSSSRTAWEDDGSMIVVLQVDDEKGLQEVATCAKREGLASNSEYDEGLTEVADGTWTVVAVGPDKADRVNAVTGRLKLFQTKEEEDIKDLRRRLHDAEAELAQLSRGSFVPPPGDQRVVGNRQWCLHDGESWFLLDLQASQGLQPQQPSVPELFEQWCWEGDTTILPLKWEQGLTDCCEGTVAPPALRPWEGKDFDPNGIFFVTHRSDTCGVAIAMSTGQRAEGVIAVLGVHPKYRRRGLGRCLLRFCIQRLAELHCMRIFCSVDTSRSPAAAQFLTAEGFLQSAVGPAVAAAATA